MRNVALALGLASLLILAACKKQEGTDVTITPAAEESAAPEAMAPEAAPAMPEAAPPCDPNDPAANCEPAPATMP